MRRSDLLGYPCFEGTAVCDPSWDAFLSWKTLAQGTEIVTATEDIGNGNFRLSEGTAPWYSLATAIFEEAVHFDAIDDDHDYPSTMIRSYPDHDLFIMSCRMTPYTWDEDYHSDIIFTRIIRGEKWLHIDVRYHFNDICWVNVIGSSVDDALFLKTFFTMIKDSLSQS